MSVKSTYRFARVPEWVLIHPALEAVDVRVYAILDRFDGRECIPALATVGAMAGGLSESTVRRSIRRLEAVGAVSREDRVVDGRQTSNRYHLAGDSPLDALSPMTGPPVTGDTLPPVTGDTLPPVTGDRGTRARKNESKKNEKTHSSEADASDGDDPDSALFDRFWNSYPRHESKQAAVKAFRAALRRGDLDDMRAGLRRWRDHWVGGRVGVQFIPHAATWLNQRRYLDTPPPPVASRTSAGTVEDVFRWADETVSCHPDRAS